MGFSVEILEFQTAGYVVVWKHFPAAGYLDTTFKKQQFFPLFPSWTERNVKFHASITSFIVVSFASEFFWQLAGFNKSVQLISALTVL